MNSEHFIKFAKYFMAFCYNAEHNPAVLLGEGQVRPEFYNDIAKCLPQSRVFEISDEIKKLLSLTDTPLINDEVKLPFQNIFLDIEFTKEELAGFGIEIEARKIIGVLIREGILTDGKDKFGKDLRLSVMLEGVNEQGKEDIWFVTFNRNFNLEKEYEGMNIKHIKLPHSDEKSENFIYKFFLNFLNFLYNPETEYVEVSRSQKNVERRAKQGKLPIPTSYKIFLTGKLKEYVDKLCSGGKFHYHYSFWVHGYYKTLRAERWGKKRGMRIFVPPFIKGEGLLVEKSYILKDTDERGLI